MFDTIEMSISVDEALGQIDMEVAADYYGEELVDYIKEKYNLVEDEE